MTKIDPLHYLVAIPTHQEHVMAQKIQTLFIDDIDGGEAAGTVRFGLDGTEYEIDLSTKHDQELRAALGTYVAPARKIGGVGRRARRPAALPPAVAASPAPWTR